MSDDGAICVIGYDETGRAIASAAARHYDLGQQSLVEALDDLWFFYGDNADKLRDKITLDLSVPEAEKIRGKVVYLGGLWVHPEVRNAIMADLPSREPKLAKRRGGRMGRLDR